MIAYMLDSIKNLFQKREETNQENSMPAEKNKDYTLSKNLDHNITRIKHEGVVSAGVGQLIRDHPNSIFPLIQTTERPDKVVASLTDGRIAILTEGTPGVILVPVTLPMLIQSVDDYHEQWIIATFIRISRYAALFISVLLPTLYIAITSFHPGPLPTTLALSIAGTRAGVPFPALIKGIGW